MNKSLITALLCGGLSLSMTVSAQDATQNAPTVGQLQGVTNAQFNKDWAEIDKRPLPSWFNEAKFGIFVVWGPYSVPAYSPVGPNGYAEWYWARLRSNDAAIKTTNNPIAKFHRENYGDRTMEDLVDDLTAEFFDAKQWCDLFKRSGAKYVVTTCNYHDGFAMYPTEYSATESTDQWNSMVRGPKRDIIGELNEAGDKLGLKMGIYYSLYEWYHPLWLTDKDKFVTDWFHPKFKEVVERYKPYSIFFDGDWGMTGEKWRANELAKWLYTESSVKDVIVTNDRWGSSRGINGDVFESEYGYGKWTSPEHPWQEDRGIGQSYGYNRMEGLDDYNSTDELLEQLSLVTAGGGNFLLCVGPTADGRIPVIMQQRLVDIGEWLKGNGDAIYGANASPFWPRTFDWGTITSKQDKLYLHLFNPDDREVMLDGIDGDITAATIFDVKGERVPLKYGHKKGTLSISIPDNVRLASTVNIIELQTKGEVVCDKRQRVSRDGELFLTGRAFTYSSPKIKAVYGGFRDRMRMVGWTDAKDSATTEVVITKAGEYDLSLTYFAQKHEVGADLEISIAGQTLHHATVLSLENKQYSYDPHKVGTVKIDKPGTYTIKIGAKSGGKWKNFGLQTLQMQLK